ncbi:penicillin acylase family protein [Streptomyces sp. NPDC018031]|uniref:penicillin acylase family protein n=1 Tax=Streptomyces sp. NPDC018031 TaxID=3365033 RepID=UPI0037AF3D13
MRVLAVTGIALLTTATVLPNGATAGERDRTHHPTDGGLSAVIRYTEYGIPHIVADDYADLGFGEGWAQAADQVCVLADGFVTTRGERSRYFGPDASPGSAMSSAGTNLASDLFFRGVKDARTVDKLYAQPAPAGPSRQVKELMRGWAAGYNAWLKQNRITDPACRGADWVRPVSTLDVARHGYSLSVLSGQGLAVDGITSAQPPGAGTTRAGGAGQGTRKVPDDPGRAARELFAQDGSGLGSNAVAFHGSTTAGGRGLLLGNPHYPWHGGRRFWQSHVTIPGELDAAGGSLLGAPTISIGHNARVAWSHTVATGVPVNLFELKTSPTDPTAYLVDGKTEKMTKRTVTVPVRGADGGTGQVTRTQWWTRYGPVVTALEDLTLPWTSRTVYALNDPNAANLRFFDMGLGFSKARSVDGVRAALRRTQGLPWVNTVAADAAGRTLYTQSQVLPRITDDLARRCSTPLGEQTYPAAGLAVLDGSRGDCAPGRDRDAVQPGIFGPSAMPTLVDAPYAENSNDSPWLANADRPLTGYPRVFGDIGTPRSLRTRGAVEDVSAMARRGGLTVEDLRRQQFANRVPAGDKAAADAARACAALPAGTAVGSDGRSVDVSEACRVLRDWDRTVRTDSRGALLFDRFWRKLTAQVPPGQLWRTPFSAADPVGTPHTLNTGAPGFARALADAVGELRAAGIPLDARLGDHQVVVRNGKRLPVSGGANSLGVWNMLVPVWDARQGGYHEVVHGSSYIQAVGFDGSRCPVAYTLLTYSQSSNPASPHYSDQTELYSAGRMVKERFCEKDIRDAPNLRVVRVGER